MSRMVKFLAIAVILFSAAATASWYLQHQQNAEPVETKAEEKKSGKANSHAAKGNAPDNSPARPLIRAHVAGDADKLAVMSLNLQQQQEALKKREFEIVDREKQTDLIHVEIKKEHKKLDEYRKTIQTELALLQEKIDLFEKRSAEGEKQRKQIARDSQDLDGKITTATGIEAVNIPKLAKIYEKMESESAAQIIEQMVEKGKLDTAVGIIATMSQRQAASVLAEITKLDTSVAVQIVERVKLFKSNAPKAPQ